MMDRTPASKRGIRPTLALVLGSAIAATALVGARLSAAETTPARTPEQIYASSCKFCHGHVIAPGVRVAPDLLGRQLDPDMIRSFVRHGPGAMLSFREADISNAELDGLAKWISRSPAPVPAPASAPGSAQPRKERP